MSGTERVTNGELNERTARLEAKLEAHEKLVQAEAVAIERRFQQAEKSVDTAIAAVDRSNSKSEAATERRFESVNEFRKSLDDAARMHMPRIESEGLHKATNEKTDRMASAHVARMDQIQKSALDKIDTLNMSLTDKIDASGKAQGARLEQVNQILGEKVDRYSKQMMDLQTLVSGLNLRREGASEGKKEGYAWIAAVIALAIGIAGFLRK